MRWFNTKYIRNKEELTEEELNYIKGSSLNYFAPFYVLIRNHWDLFLAAFLLGGFGKAISETRGGAGILFLVYFAGLIALYYFGIKHIRRLSWNRGKNSWSFKGMKKWESFEEYKNSEKKWKPWGYFGTIISIIIFLLSL